MHAPGGHADPAATAEACEGASGAEASYTAVHGIIRNHLARGNRTAVAALIALPPFAHAPAFWQTMDYRHALAAHFIEAASLPSGASNSTRRRSSSDAVPSPREACSAPLTVQEAWALLEPAAEAHAATAPASGPRGPLAAAMDRLRLTFDAAVAEGAAAATDGGAGVNVGVGDGWDAAAVAALLRATPDAPPVVPAPPVLDGSSRKRQRSVDGAPDAGPTGDADAPWGGRGSRSAQEAIDDDADNLVADAVDDAASVGVERALAALAARPGAAGPAVVAAGPAGCDFDEVADALDALGSTSAAGGSGGSGVRTRPTRRNFTPAEDDAIRDGVALFYGHGRFNAILGHFASVFQRGRTAEQLRNHWKQSLRLQQFLPGSAGA